MLTTWDISFLRFGGFAFPALVVLLAVLIVAVLFTRRTLADGTAVLTPRRLVESYVFTVVLVSMLLASVGLADLVRAGIGKKFGLETAYHPQPVWSEDHKPGERPKFEYDQKAPRRDALSGVAELSIGLVIGFLHLLGLGRLSRSEPVGVSPVFRLFLVVGLVIYTTAVLTYVVGSVKDVLVYRYVGLPPIESWYQRPLPGNQIAGLMGFSPFWAVLVQRLFRYARVRATPQNRA